MKDEIITEHPSYGLIEISRMSCQPAINVFGSSIKTANPISLKILTTKKYRSLNRETYHGRKQIVEVWLSPAQFAEAITTLNMGSGTPVTIKRIQGEPVEECPDEAVNELFNEEFRDDINSISNQLTELKRVSDQILGSKGGLKVSEKQTLMSMIFKIEQDVRANLPFVHEQFTRAMDKTIAQGKAEIEAFATTAIQKVGLDNIKDLPKLLTEEGVTNGDQ